MGIMLLLAGVLVTAVRGAVRSARGRRAETEAQAIVRALKSYRAAYGLWPGQTNACDVTLDGDRHGLFLAGLTNGPRGEVFLVLPTRAGEGGRVITDPWDRPYLVAMDWEGDGCTAFTGTSRCVPPVVICTNVADTAAVMSWGSNPSDRRCWVQSWRR
ncbi:MAG: hypothetical protein FJ224_08660 [Lentisphaerae bacterium]|nr:hypothetical protein [Lentisphaerota bacterium]